MNISKGLLLSTSHCHRISLFVAPFHTAPHSLSGALATNLIKSYCLKGSPTDARRVFDEIPNKDVVAWTAMISGYTMCGRNFQAMYMFSEMRRGEEAVELTAFPISSALKACKGMGCSSSGAMVHGLAIKNGVDGSIYVENALMDMYATCKDTMDDACSIFERIGVKNAVSWTTMIASYTHRGHGFAAIQVFMHMLQVTPAEMNPIFIHQAEGWTFHTPVAVDLHGLVEEWLLLL